MKTSKTTRPRFCGDTDHSLTNDYDDCDIFRGQFYFFISCEIVSAAGPVLVGFPPCPVIVAVSVVLLTPTFVSRKMVDMQNMEPLTPLVLVSSQ